MRHWWTLLFVISLLFIPQVSLAASITDGVYQVPFKVLKAENDDLSMANDYLETPAQVTVQGGQATVQMTLKNSSWWKEFKVEGKDVRTVSDVNDVRVVNFEVNDLTKIAQSNIHVIVPDINYDNHYVIRFNFDTSALPVANDTTPKAEKAESSTVVASSDQSSGTPATVVNPKTGDDTPLLALLVLLIFSSYFLMKQHRKHTM